MAAAGQDTWVARMVKLLQGYGLFEPTIYNCAPNPHVTLRIIKLADLEAAFNTRLEAYWAAWEAPTNAAGRAQATAHRHKYATLFKTALHIDKRAYRPLLDPELPTHLRRVVLRLRACVLRINGNTWVGRGTPTCPLCAAGTVEDEEHLLRSCTAHSALRTTHNVLPGMPVHRMFIKAVVRNTALFVSAALRLREAFLQAPH
jgi:hypothetical protein